MTNFSSFLLFVSPGRDGVESRDVEESSRRGKVKKNWSFVSFSTFLSSSSTLEPTSLESPGWELREECKLPSQPNVN
jgi:hypothetical protein